MDTLQVLFVVVNNPDHTERILEILLECEIRGATIIESMGMGQILGENIPVIGSSLRSLLGQQHEHNQTIFAVSRHPAKIDKAMGLISEELNGFQEPCSGVMFVLPVIKAVGIGNKKHPEQDPGD